MKITIVKLVNGLYSAASNTWPNLHVVAESRGAAARLLREVAEQEKIEQQIKDREDRVAE